MENKPLHIRIKDFIDRYAAINPNWKQKDEPWTSESKYTGPDVYQLIDAADLIEKGVKPVRVWSEWESGCYKPYSHKEGRELHDSLVQEIYSYKP